MIRNILAVIAGLVIGGLVNMALITVSSSVIPPPAGVDMTTAEGLQAGMHLLESKHFVFPFLAHALGTLAGALVAALLAASQKMKFALGIGVFFLLGGIVASFMIQEPIWLKALDIIAAYIPMAWIGGKLAGAGRSV